MALTRLSSWVSSRFTVRKSNVVAPVQIIVQPRQQESSSHRGHQLDPNIPVFAIEDQRQFALLWYPNDNHNMSVAQHLNRIVPHNDIVILEHGDGISNASTANGFEESSYNSRSNIFHEVFRLRLSVSNCFHQILSRVNAFKRASPQPNHEAERRSYIHSYLRMMYLFCISAVRTQTNRQESSITLKQCTQWIGLKLQLAIFIVFSLLSAFQSFCQAKYDVVWFLFQGGFNQFVKFSFHITCLVTSIYFSYLFCTEWDSVKKMVDVMSTYERNLVSQTKKPAVAVVMAVITALFAFSRSLVLIDIKDFSIEDAMLESSYQMSEDLFLWSSQNLNVSIQKLDEEFGSDLNSTQSLLAVVKIERDFAYYLQEGMLWDLILCVVFALFSWMKVFMTQVIEVVENIRDENSQEWRALQQRREVVWRMYREIRIVFEAINDVFDTLLIFFHASNVLQYAFFVEIVIYPENNHSLTYIYLLYNITKSEITYMMASRIAQQNKIIRKWLRNWGSRGGKIDVGDEEIDLTAILDELDEEPLGLGKGDFMINPKFHFGLLGLVSSLFVMLASKKQ